MKILNIIALLIWTFQLFYGVTMAVAGKYIHPVIYICAVFVCILNYINAVGKGDWRND